MHEIHLLMMCTAGFEDPGAEAASATFRRFRVLTKSGGLIEARAVTSVRELQAFPATKNVFSVIQSIARSTVAQEADSYASTLPSAPRPRGIPSRGSIRLRIHSDGSFTSTNTPSARDLEEVLGRWTGLRVSRRSASTEIWMIRRAELPTTFLASKLTVTSASPARGELRPEICAALARLVPLQNAELVIDPFAGSGAIGQACLEAGAREVWCNDIDPSSATKRSAGLRWSSLDLRDLDVPAGGADAVVTDPPWGVFRSVPGDVASLYRDLGAAAREWLRPGGRIVTLSAAPPEATAALLSAGDFELDREFHVLVNGRKAKVIVATTAAR